MKTNPNWYYEEKTPGVDYLNPKIAQKYDAEHQKFRNFKEESEHIVQVMEITPEDTVMDFGCGTGGVALNLAKYCDKVICVDISREMLDVLENKAKKLNINNIETYSAGFLTYNHNWQDKVNKIVSMVALHHLPDFWKSVALLKMAEILKPGEKLYLFDIIFTFNIQDHQKSIEKMIKDMQDVAGDSMAHETEIHIKDEFSTYDWIMEGLLEKTGFLIDSKKIKSSNFVEYICSKL
ncbi:class I SAM-dependent methyltransferase [Methanobacterium petrolearium]|uniref:class I SAM-dependent methyltransferase n=1 Tax=Methanobacterium petrolearium TaxID=710190 RepID=UPI001AE236DD|nr:class I SAM-dependent methyltransferase [Methanobacterium petrolearium]MBP1946855.1 ubiquinone/menaquinone biosynthesis C-methylase UbiE [Methanobacterium petrolearium]BDZ70467.1 class I SAM-dependent methyltransferase [Methanobacterium petrolearium]